MVFLFVRSMTTTSVSCGYCACASAFSSPCFESAGERPRCARLAPSRCGVLILSCKWDQASCNFLSTEGEYLPSVPPVSAN
jgi:hypothetical protein